MRRRQPGGNFLLGCVAWSDYDQWVFGQSIGDLRCASCKEITEKYFCARCNANEMLEYQKLYREYRCRLTEALEKYPLACGHCKGTGERWAHYPGDRETPSGPEWVNCSNCVQKGLCPRCSAPYQELNAACVCGFSFENNKPVLPEEPETIRAYCPE